MRIDKPALFILLNTCLLILFIEAVSYSVLHRQGIDSSFLINNRKLPRESSNEERFRTLDPHLGYAHGADESSVKDIGVNFTWVDGFVVYEKSSSALQHPVILALGGSTTDGARFGHSWPEDLSVILKEKGIWATVVNGGTGGYSTSQELLKLIRDGLEFEPDIVISYSGINDRGKYSVRFHPMVHSYQGELLESLSKNSQPNILPSAITLLKKLSGNNSSDPIPFTYGVKSRLTLAQQYRKNMRLMKNISTLYGAEFFGFIQPFAFYKSSHANDPGLVAKGGGYKESVLALYEEISKLPAEFPYIHDATQILEGHSHVYTTDGVHLEAEGDKVVAEYIFSVIEPAITRADVSRRKSAL